MPSFGQEVCFHALFAWTQENPIVREDYLTTQLAQKCFADKSGSDCRDEVRGGIGFQNIALSSSSKCLLGKSVRIVLAKKNDSTVGSDLVNAGGGFDPAQCRHGDIKDDHVRLKFFGIRDAIEAVCCLTDHFKAVRRQ